MADSIQNDFNSEEQKIDDLTGTTGAMAHEISGLTEGKMGDGADDWVTVAVSDKNTKSEANERDGTGMVAISYMKGGLAQYEVIDFKQSDGQACFKTFTTPDGKKRQMGGFEDVSYKPGPGNGPGTYYFVQEGGDTWNPDLLNKKDGTLGAKEQQHPAIFKAKLVNIYGSDKTTVVGHAMQLVEDKPIVVPAKDLVGAYGNWGNGVEGMAVDKNGNIYVGFQDSGKIFKGTLNGDQYTWGKTAVLDTNTDGRHGDLAGMTFDNNGNLVVSFGSHSGNPNSAIVYHSNGGDDWKELSTTSINNVYGNDMADAEAIMVDHDNRVVAGSDNGEKGNTKFQNLGLVQGSSQDAASIGESQQNTVLGNEQQNTATS